MQNLLKELSDATCANRQLDLKIERYLNTSSILDDELDRNPDLAEHYTSSIDIVMNLIPGNLFISIERTPKDTMVSLSQNSSLGGDGAVWLSYGKGKTMALAICAAFVQYRMNTDKKNLE